MYHNTTRKRENRRQATRNIISADIEDFPIIKNIENSLCDENVGRYILSGKDSVTSADLAALKTEILGDTNIQQNLDTLKEIVDAIGNPDNHVGDLITRINGHSNKLDKITVSNNINLNAITGTHIIPSTINNTHIATNSVTTDKIVNGNITISKIADSSVTTIKLSGKVDGNGNIITETWCFS